MTKPNPNVLLVEGDDDKRVIPELMEANGISWGATRESWPVEIKPYDGIKNIVKQGVIETELKASGLKVLGIIADANDCVDSRWDALRNRCIERFPNLPDALPADGVIEENEDGLKLGIWLLPDNRSHGMMETFLTYLVRTENDAVLKHA